MIIVDTALRAREEQGKPIRVGMIGAGFMGQGLTNQIVNSVPGMRMAAIYNRRPERALGVYRYAGCEIAFAEGAGPDLRNYRADFRKITRVLPGFRPQWDARKGAKQLYDAYQSIGLRVEDFEGPRYRRIDQLKALLASGHVGPDLRWAKEVVEA